MAYRPLSRMIDVRPEEVRALVWSWLYIFSILSSYYIIRPIRDEMGVAGGVENLPWLFTGTLVGIMAVNPPFAALVKKLPRERFISIAYRFLITNLLVFVLLLKASTAAQSIWVGRAFFIWTSMLKILTVSLIPVHLGYHGGAVSEKVGEMQRTAKRWQRGQRARARWRMDEKASLTAAGMLG